MLAAQHRNPPPPPHPLSSSPTRPWNNNNNTQNEDSYSGGPKDASYYLNKAKEEVATRHRSAYLEQIRGSGSGSGAALYSGGGGVRSPTSMVRSSPHGGGSSGAGGMLGLSPAAASQREALLRKYQPQGTDYSGVSSPSGGGAAAYPVAAPPLSSPNYHQHPPPSSSHRYMSPVISSPNVRLPSSMFESPSRVVLHGGTVRSPYHHK